MAKNVRIVPASGSIFFTADGFDVTGIGLTSASAKLEVSSSVNETPFIVSTPSSSLKINKEGILEISEYSGVATPVDGGLIYSASQFFIGI
jgi:hypothetical protein